MSIQDQAIARAISFLNAAGAVYLIRHNGETVADTLPQAVKKTRVLVNNFSRDTGYVKTINDMPPGMTHRFARKQWPELFKSDLTWKSFVASVKSTTVKRFGKDSVLFEHNDEYLDVMRGE